jgi:hypothetical protein
LDEIFFLQAELARYREKFRGNYTVLAAWAEIEIAPVVSAGDEAKLGGVAWLRNLYRLGAAAGGGTPMIFHPETSLFLFREVRGAARSVEHLSEALFAFGGTTSETEDLPWRLSVATGEDFLAENSPRVLRESPITQRALALLQGAKQGVVLLDEITYRHWPYPDHCRQIVSSGQICWEFVPTRTEISAPSIPDTRLPTQPHGKERKAPVEIEESRRKTW